MVDLEGMGMVATRRESRQSVGSTGGDDPQPRSHVKVGDVIYAVSASGPRSAKS